VGLLQATNDMRIYNNENGILESVINETAKGSGEKTSLLFVQW